MIPEEIRGFLSHGGGSSLIIQGTPGTGKTTLAFELMDTLPDLNPIYLSTRATAEAIYRYFPRLHQKKKEIEIIESKNVFWDRFFKKVDNKAPRVEKDIFEVYGMLDDPDKADFSDLDTVCDRIDSFLPEKSMLVMDSLEGLCDKYRVSETFLIGIITRCLVEPAHTKVVIVLEKESNIELGYIADGVVSMQQKDVEGRRLRILTIDKLRGINIRQPNYLYTLNNGRFHSFGAFKVEHPIDYKPFDPTPNTKTHYSTGNRDLDDVFGGYQVGGYILLETGANVDNFFYVLPMLTAANVVSQDGGAVILSVSGAGPSEVKNYVFEYGLSDKLKSFRVVTEENPEEPVTEDFVVSYDRNSFSSDSNVLDKEINKLQIEYSGKVVKIVDYRILETMLDQQILKKTIISEKKYSAANRLLTVVMCGDGTAPEIKKTLADVSDMHLKLDKCNNTMIFYGKKPTTGIYVIEPDVSHGYKDVKLTSVR
ncbi:MAG TPA: hypothetical protein EYP67_00680 [Methanosarcinales archaeon]|nr:hypothetical protein [Methanosarcinales archaeon]